MFKDILAIWQELRFLTDRMQAIADDVTVIFVANRQRAVTDSPLDRSTEYFTDDEANQILTALKESGFRTMYFEGEDQFISFVLKGKHKAIQSRWTIVYNTAQSGTDPGRKSMVPAFCALHGLPTCNSDSYAVSLARHKLHVHAILRRYGIPTPDTWAFDARLGWLRNECPPRDVLLIAKAGYESASIGLDEFSIGHMSRSFEEVLTKKSSALNQHFVVQRFISGNEFEVPIINIGNRRGAVAPVAITINGDHRLGERVLLYASVAEDRFGFARCPEDYTAESARMRDAAAAVCEVLGLKGFARVDFRVDDDRGVWVTDVSTSPHIVAHSAYWHSFSSEGWSYSDMLGCMIAVNASNYHWLENCYSDQT
jgi:D-alanine-D-alanine ligase